MATGGDSNPRPGAELGRNEEGTSEDNRGRLRRLFDHVRPASRAYVTYEHRRIGSLRADREKDHSGLAYLELGFDDLAKQVAGFEKQVGELLNMAEDDPAAAVYVRLQRRVDDMEARQAEGEDELRECLVTLRMSAGWLASEAARLLRLMPAVVLVAHIAIEAQDLPGLLSV